MAWLDRLINVFRPAKLHNEIDEELRFHIDARIADNTAAGMSAEEARADALRRFGGAVVALERSRDADLFVWLETILQDLRYGARNLRSNPGVTAVAVLSLALAAGASIAIFSVVNAVLLRSFPYKNPERIAILWVTNTINGSLEMNASVPNFEDWRKRTRTLEDLTLYRARETSFLIDGQADTFAFAFIHGDFYRLFGRAPILGRVFGEEGKGRPEAVISHRLWMSRFAGSPDVLGRMVNLNGIGFAITGVMPEDFGFPARQTDLWIPASAYTFDWQQYNARRQRGFGTVAGRLRAGVTLDQARAEMEVINRQLAAAYPDANADRGINILPLAAQIHGKTVPFMLAVLSGAVLLVLLIACANAASLLLARGAARSREIALRNALGAGRRRILRQLITESLLLSGIAAVLGLPIAQWGIRALIALAPGGIARIDEAHIDTTVLIFSLGLSVATGLLFGIAPAIRMSREVSGNRVTSSVESRGLRRAFVVAEIALAVVLLTGAGLLLRSFAAVQAVDPGFRTGRVLTATLGFAGKVSVARYRDTIAAIKRLPGVHAAGAIDTMFFPFREDRAANFGLRAMEGRVPEAREQWTPMAWSTVSGDYFQALGVPLVRGRFFNDRDTRGTTPVVIINETMARRYWPDRDPIGAGIKGFDARGRNDEWVRVIGVVKDVHSRGREHEPMAQIYETQEQSTDQTTNLAVCTEMSADALRDALRAIDSAATLRNVTTLDDRLREQNAPRRFQTTLLSLFAALALLLAGAGIFATMHYSVAQRTKEIGIRVAMGAPRGTVARMILREGLVLAGAGAAIGIAGSFALTRSIRNLLFEVGPGDPATLGGVALLLTGIALLACYAPARRAMRLDPMRALRCE
jgi:putative ABC transport system permease protein